MSSKVADIAALFVTKYQIPVSEAQLQVEGNLMSFGPKKVTAHSLTWEQALEPATIEFQLLIVPK